MVVQGLFSRGGSHMCRPATWGDVTFRGVCLGKRGETQSYLMSLPAALASSFSLGPTACCSAFICHSAGGTSPLALLQIHQHIHEMTPHQVILAFGESLSTTPHTCCSTAAVMVREGKIKKDFKLFLRVRDVLPDVWDSLVNVIWLQQRTAKCWLFPGLCFSLM